MERSSIDFARYVLLFWALFVVFIGPVGPASASSDARDDSAPPPREAPAPGSR